MTFCLPEHKGKEKEEGRYSVLNWLWQICLFRKKKKHLPDEMLQERTEQSVYIRFYVLVKIVFYKT